MGLVSGRLSTLLTIFTSRNDVQKIVFFPSGCASILWSARRNLSCQEDVISTDKITIATYPWDVGIPLYPVSVSYIWFTGPSSPSAESSRLIVV